MTTRVEIDRYKLRRFIAAYKLRLAEKAKALGARPETWGRGQAISIDEEKKYLTDEDRYRLAPYPYPGLRSFEKDEGDLFFGRTRNVETLRAILAEQRMVAVLGGSGSGKSSLVRAGLLPFLNTEQRIKGRDGNWYSVDFRPRTDPFGELSSALVDQVLRPLLRMRRKGLPLALDLPEDVDGDAPDTIELLRERIRKRFTDARKEGRGQVLKTLLDIVEQQLDSYDNIVTRGRRLAKPNLFLLVDQLEEVFRPEIVKEERDALLNLIVDLHGRMQDASQHGGLFLAATIRSEEVYRCAEHRGLSDVVIGRGGYQIELLDPNDKDPANKEDIESLRDAILQPARNVFNDWGLEQYLDHEDAPFEKGLPARLLKGAANLSAELNHRPDQLPLLQHALQAMWHAAIRRWSRPDFKAQRLEITRDDLPGQAPGWEDPDLSACLKTRADKAKDRAIERFVETIREDRQTGAKADEAVGEEALQAAFRSLARRDDQGNWARRFAGKDEITAFLTADPTSAVARLPKDLRWRALKEALRVFLLRGYLSQGTERKYDISHEALIRNWPLFQDWLRAPEEVAYALGRVLQEVDPAKFKTAWFLEKMRLIPNELADRVTSVSEGGALPTRWGEDQIAPYLRRPTLRERWGKEKSGALLKLTEIAVSAKRAQWLKAGLGGLVIVAAGALILAGANYYQKVEADKIYTKEVAAYSYIAELQLPTPWPDGLRERTAIHAFTMMNGGGQEGNPKTTHDAVWQSWDEGVRHLLGQTLRVERTGALAADAFPACVPIKGDPNRETLTSRHVPLAGAPGTDVRFLIKSDGGPARLLFETRKDAGNWIAAEEEAQPFNPIAGIRLCLAPNGTALTISYRGSSFPFLFELNWYTCLDDQNCNETRKWHIAQRQINPVPLRNAIQGATFSCVRSVNVIPQSEKTLSRIEVDFTDQSLEECSNDETPTAVSSGAKLLRGTYLPGITRPTWNDGSLLVSPDRFSKCDDTSKDGRVSRECKLSDGPNKKMTLTLARKHSDIWTISINPVDPNYPVKQVELVAPPITHAAIDENKNIWLGDGKGHSWVLINDRTALMNELWRRTEPLQHDPDWDKEKENPYRVRNNMTAADIANKGPFATSKPKPQQSPEATPSSVR